MTRLSISQWFAEPGAIGAAVLCLNLLTSGAGAVTLQGPFVPGSGHWDLLPNGDFETGNTTGFSVHIGHPSISGTLAADPGNAYSGNYGGSLTFDAGSGLYGIAIAGDAVTLPVGGNYVLSGFVRVDLADSGVAGRLDRFGASSETYFDTSQTGWQFVYEEFVNNSGFWYPRFHLGASMSHYLTAGDVLYVDNFALTPASEFRAPTVASATVPDGASAVGLLGVSTILLAFSTRRLR